MTKFFALLVLLLASFVDILVTVTQVFPFIQLNDLLYLSSFIFTGPVIYQVLTLVALIYILAFTGFLGKYFFISTLKHNSLYLYGLLGLSLLLCNGGLIRSQSYFFIKNHQESFNAINHNNTLLVKNKFDSVTKSLFVPNAVLNNKILLVVNESWGQTTDPKIQAAILKPLYDKKQALDYIEDGGFQVIGATIHGELREVCQKNPLVMDITQINDKEFHNCLPAILNEKGYLTYSIYGSDGNLYNAYRWYRLAGFQHRYFKENFPQLRNCKAFNGKCDFDLMPIIADIFAKDQKTLVYWMTLNSHTPYDDTLFIDGFDCNLYNLESDSESCHNLKLQYQYFARLAQFIDTPQMRGVQVFIVGDHSPPIMDLRKNFNVFKGTNVAWVKFKVKS